MSEARAQSWAKWPDVLIDFGQQLYIAWQLTEGRVLYEELVYNYGSLTPYLNALAFSLFGPSIAALVGLNLAALAGILGLMYHLLLRTGDRLGAATGGIVFAAVFAFSQMSGIGNYNYATPYENSLTIGLLCALAAVSLAVRFVERGGLGAAAGAALGAPFLTKPAVRQHAPAGLRGLCAAP